MTLQPCRIPAVTASLISVQHTFIQAQGGFFTPKNQPRQNFSAQQKFYTNNTCSFLKLFITLQPKTFNDRRKWQRMSPKPLITGQLYEQNPNKQLGFHLAPAGDSRGSGRSCDSCTARLFRHDSIPVVPLFRNTHTADEQPPFRQCIHSPRRRHRRGIL